MTALKALAASTTYAGEAASANARVWMLELKARTTVTTAAPSVWASMGTVTAFTPWVTTA